MDLSDKLLAAIAEFDIDWPQHAFFVAHFRHLLLREGIARHTVPKLDDVGQAVAFVLGIGRKGPKQFHLRMAVGFSLALSCLALRFVNGFFAPSHWRHRQRRLIRFRLGLVKQGKCLFLHGVKHNKRIFGS